MADYEKLGLFYLGKEYDLPKGKLQDNLMLYESKDLLTHAMAVGMTGSGKTGLCIGIIEEAAIDGVPAIIIDPKGDLTNLLLTFPQLRGEDLAPWVQPEDAVKNNQSIGEYAQAQAQMWEKGLADWGQSKERIARLRAAVEMDIYTPGSTAGRQVSILRTLAAPPVELAEDGEAFQEKVASTVSSILGLIHIDADPLNSREHILLSNILAQAWAKGVDVELSGLISAIQKPAFSKIGVLDLESFYPEKERFSLMMALNNLIASPGFAAWMDGEPLEIADILYTRAGKPKVAIFSIAHLGDSERMFFVSLLLNQILGWVRSQSGTPSLRALLYMDEIFGFFPPVANPPSKKPLLSLLKQARAFGLGVVLSTQNPADIDYKGLANIGTWFIGRLQTERDKMKMLEGLQGVASSQGSGFNADQMEKILSGLGKRVFLMHNVHDNQPTIFQTRWCLSYLAGPLTRNQIKALMAPQLAGVAQPAARGEKKVALAGAAAGGVSAAAPAVPGSIRQLYLPVRGGSEGVRYVPALAAAIDIAYTNSKAKLDESESLFLRVPADGGVLALDWDNAERLDVTLKELEDRGESGTGYAELPSALANPKSYPDWEKDAARWAFDHCGLSLYYNSSAKVYSQIGEDERAFRLRVDQTAREERSDVVEALRKKYAAKIEAAEEKVRKASQAVDREKDQSKDATLRTALSVGSSLFGSLLGGRKVSASTLGRAGSGISRHMSQSGDVKRAEETLESYSEALEDLKQEMEAELEALENKLEQAHGELETIEIKPKKSDITVKLVALLWEPIRQQKDGNMEKAW